MSATVLDGKSLAAKVKAQIKDELAARADFAQKPPVMALLLVGEDPGSACYVRLKAKACKNVGITAQEKNLPATISTAELLAEIRQLNNDPAVDAILVQLPLPPHLDKNEILAAIDPQKDVDCFHPYNVGLLHSGQPCLRPCTPAGIMALLAEYKINLSGKKALVIGRSNIVGTPLACLLKQADATVTLAHSKTLNLPQLAREADLIVAAAGVAGLVTGAMVKTGAIVVDVGQNHDASGDLVGDVVYEEVAAKAAYLTPVPGGVGPLTIAFLLKNCWELAKKHER